LIYSTATVSVNPPGELPLTLSQLWQGLVLKARDARKFLPPGACTACEVVHEGPGFIVREAVILGDPITEIIVLEPMKKVSFFQKTSPREGVIVNEILGDAQSELQLRFYAYLGLLGAEAGSPKELEAQAQMDSQERGYPAALRSTLKRIRELVSAGEL
jgi:hypothetical protein